MYNWGKGIIWYRPEFFKTIIKILDKQIITIDTQNNLVSFQSSIENREPDQMVYKV